MSKLQGPEHEMTLIEKVAAIIAVPSFMHFPLPPATPGVLCRMCQREGIDNEVRVMFETVTLVGYPTFRDEQGREHHHDANIKRQMLVCSRGHSWSEESTGSCWCGWPKSGPYVEVSCGHKADTT